ncbi:Mfa1 family fimbria major subunit [Porphyromonas gingivicanis]|uniref:Mfa1 family fimbria major subunit n=1 Tax=Porphyromonas gingivicanis TaxID=266762 RepID=UPI00056D6F58|nr:Mfa1 family fimbria major subunit [Porphyromonas gingivicanis]
MKMKSILVAGLALFLGAMTSCNKGSEELNGKTEKGDTYASVTLSLGGDAFRTEEDDFNKRDDQWEGNDAIKTVDVYLVDATTVSSGQYTLADFTIVKNAGQETKLNPNKAIKTTAGPKKVYVLVNAPQEIRRTLAVTEKGAFDRAWAEIYVAHNIAANTAAYKTDAPAAMKKLMTQETNGEDLIMMSNSEECTIDVQPNVTYEAAMAPAPQNRATAKVKRVAARVVLTTAKDAFEIENTSTGQKIGKITEIKYAVAQGEKRMFIQQKIETGIIKTPAYAVVTGPFSNPQTYTDMNDNYDYSDLFVKDRPATVQTFGSLNSELIGKIERPAFILEANHKRNTAPNNTPATYDGDFRRGNTPYVLVRTKFEPYDAAFAEGNSKNELVDGTFYLGTTTGKLYSKVENVIDPDKGGLVGQKYRKYEGGKVLYYAYVNPDIVERPKTLNAPAFRNNVYHVHIRNIKALGFNWNPLYPEDPDNPGSDYPVNPDPRPNEDDPTPPVKPEDPLGDKDTYMSVAVQVLKWNVHSYEVDLGL